MDADVMLRYVDIEFDDAFGTRRLAQIGYMANEVDHVQVGGTATNAIDVFDGIVIHVDDSKNELTALSQGQVLTCLFSGDETFEHQDRIAVVEHMSNREDSFGTFNWFATKRQADFRLNSIWVRAYSKQGKEVGVAYIDPYLNGELWHGN